MRSWVEKSGITFKNGDRLNVHLSNLEMHHWKDLIQGEGNTVITKLTNKQVEEIRSLYKGKTGSNQLDKETTSLKDLENNYGVSKSTIAVIAHGRSVAANPKIIN